MWSQKTTKEVSTAVAAEQLGGQQIIVLGFMTSRGFSVLRQLLLNPIKQVLRNNRRNSIGYNDISIFVLSNVAAIAEHVLNAVEVQRLPQLVADAIFVQPVPQLLHGRALVIFLERIQYKGSGQRINLKMLFLINYITDRQCAAVKLALQRIFFSAADDLFRQICRVVFRIAFQHGFQNDALCALGDHFRCGHHFHAVPFQLRFIPCAVITVSRKSIQLPDDDHIKQLLATVLNHLLKIWAVIRLGGIGTVNVVAQNRNAVLLCEGGAFPNLTFDGFLPLAVGGIAGIDDCFHCFPP